MEQKFIQKAARGDADAFKHLMRQYRIQLYNYLWKYCGNKNDTDDLLQETLIKVWKGLPRYNEQNKFSSWLFSLAHNVATDNYRKNKVRAIVVSTDELPEKNIDKNNQTLIEENEVKVYINNAVNKLPERQKEVFLLRQHGDVSFKEISEMTAQPLNTVLSHMRYAIKKINKELREANVI